MNLEFLAATQNLPFGVALALVLVLLGIEVIGLFVGFGLSDLTDAMLPEMDFDLDVDIDADLDVGHGFGLGDFLLWLHFGKVPTGILIFLLIASFSISGYMIQLASLQMSGAMLSPSLASVFAFLASIPSLHYAAGAVERIIPKDETDAVSSSSFVGKSATIVLGAARRGHATQAKLTDEKGTTHYIMVEPKEDSSELSAGESLIITSMEGSIYYAIGTKEPQFEAVKTEKKDKQEIMIETK